MSEDMTAFYEQILDKTLVESSQWPSVLETESKDFKVGEIIAYLYPFPYPATQRTKSTTNKPKSNQSSWAKSSCTWKRTEWSMFGRMMKRYPLIPSLSRMRNKPISTLQGLLRWTSMRMINFLRTCDSLKKMSNQIHKSMNKQIISINFSLFSYFYAFPVEEVDSFYVKIKIRTCADSRIEGIQV